jgi:hypothetical protein
MTRGAVSTPDPWGGLTSDARRAGERARDAAAKSGLSGTTATGPDPDHFIGKIGLGLVVVVWLFGALHSLPTAVGGIEAVLALLLLRDWRGIRSRLPLLNGPRRSVATAGWIALALVGLAIFLVALR